MLLELLRSSNITTPCQVPDVGALRLNPPVPLPVMPPVLKYNVTPLPLKVGLPLTVIPDSIIYSPAVMVTVSVPLLMIPPQ